jgi:hypothetical protein
MTDLPTPPAQQPSLSHQLEGKTPATALINEKTLA